jgi:hypothetical protein
MGRALRRGGNGGLPTDGRFAKGAGGRGRAAGVLREGGLGFRDTLRFGRGHPPPS